MGAKPLVVITMAPKLEIAGRGSSENSSGARTDFNVYPVPYIHSSRVQNYNLQCYLFSQN